MDQRTLKVAFVDRSPILRAGIKAILSNQSRLVLAFESGSVRECTELLEAKPVDVVIVGLRSPVNGELENLSTLQERFPEITTILHMREGDDTVCLKALSRGVRGFLFGTFTSQEMMDTIRIASRGRIVQMPVSLMTNLVQAASVHGNGHSNQLRHGLVQLKAQELKLLAEIATGAPYKVIASRLGLAPSTVKKYAHQLITKLGARNRSDVVLKALALGLLETARLA